MTGLAIQLDVLVMKTQTSSFEGEYLSGAQPHIFSCESSNTLNSNRYQKMEIIRKEIEKVQRRINRDKSRPNSIPLTAQASDGQPDITNIPKVDLQRLKMGPGYPNDRPGAASEVRTTSSDPALAQDRPKLNI